MQTEIRMIVKENIELNRQVTCLNQRFTDPRNYAGDTPKSPLSANLESVKVPRSKSLFLDNNAICQCTRCTKKTTGEGKLIF